MNEEADTGIRIQGLGRESWSGGRSKVVCPESISSMKYPTWARQSREIRESKRDQIRQTGKEGTLATTHTKAFENLALVVCQIAVYKGRSTGGADVEKLGSWLGRSR
ncbi:hypothetical protein GOODEAATRI_015818 [Goodea atripinnis]|uniref:Uncharacterized protein n=1 Tax=Goodea atripinnis TaxID=208336 RepID=A0ABV0P4F6_9TELE